MAAETPSTSVCNAHRSSTPSLTSNVEGGAFEGPAGVLVDEVDSVELASVPLDVLNVLLDMSPVTQVPSLHVPLAPLNVHTVPSGAASIVHSPDMQNPSSAWQGTLQAENSASSPQGSCARTGESAASASATEANEKRRMVVV